MFAVDGKQFRGFANTLANNTNYDVARIKNGSKSFSRAGLVPDENGRLFKDFDFLFYSLHL